MSALEEQIMEELAFLFSLDLKNKFILQDNQIVIEINKNITAQISAITLVNLEKSRG